MAGRFDDINSAANYGDPLGAEQDRDARAAIGNPQPQMQPQMQRPVKKPGLLNSFGASMQQMLGIGQNRVNPYAQPQPQPPVAPPQPPVGQQSMAPMQQPIQQAMSPPQGLGAAMNGQEGVLTRRPMYQNQNYG